LAALELLTPDAVRRVNSLGDTLRASLRSACKSAGVAAQVTGAGSLAAVHFTDRPVRDYRSALGADRAKAARLHLSLLNRGIFSRSGGTFFLSTPMTKQDVTEVANAFAAGLVECT